MDRTVLSKVSCASTAKVLVLYRYNGFILVLSKRVLMHVSA